MKMMVYILNGSNRTGKDTFVEMISDVFKHASRFENDIFSKYDVIHLSTIDHIRKMFSSEILGERLGAYMANCLADKEDDTRSLLATFKKVFDDYMSNRGNNPASNTYIVDEIVRITRELGDDGRIPIFFVDCREDAKILDLRESLTSLGYSVKIIKHKRDVEVATNESDKEANESKFADMIIDGRASPVITTIRFIIDDIYPAIKNAENSSVDEFKLDVRIK